MNKLSNVQLRRLKSFLPALKLMSARYKERKKVHPKAYTNTHRFMFCKLCITARDRTKFLNNSACPNCIWEILNGTNCTSASISGFPGERIEAGLRRVNKWIKLIEGAFK